MTAGEIVIWSGVTCSGGLAVASLLRTRSSIPRWSFAVAMALLALEGILAALCSRAPTPDNVARLQAYRLIALAPITGAWLLFSATYSRGKAGAPSNWKRNGIICFLVIITGASWLLRDQHIQAVEQLAWGTEWRVRLTLFGTALWMVMLFGAVWIVVNLERTFRAAVGTSRWRIKYMLLGTGLLFVVRIYTSSQVVLFRGIENSVSGDFDTYSNPGDAVAFVAPYSFNSGPVGGLWQVGGFSFSLISSSIQFQGGNPGSVTVGGSGTITGNGFDSTTGTWAFSSQDPAASTNGQAIFSFSASTGAVPDGGSSVILLGSAFLALAAFVRKLRLA